MLEIIIHSEFKMVTIMKFFTFLFVIGVCLGQLSEFNVTHTDMQKTMKEFVVAESLFLISNGTKVEAVAEKLVYILDRKYGAGWFSMVGSNTAINGLKTENNTTLQFQYENTKVTISQQEVEQDHSTNSTSVKRQIESEFHVNFDLLNKYFNMDFN